MAFTPFLARKVLDAQRHILGTGITKPIAWGEREGKENLDKCACAYLLGTLNTHTRDKTPLLRYGTRNKRHSQWSLRDLSNSCVILLMKLWFQSNVLMDKNVDCNTSTIGFNRQSRVYSPDVQSTFSGFRSAWITFWRCRNPNTCRSRTAIFLIHLSFYILFRREKRDREDRYCLI